MQRRPWACEIRRSRLLTVESLIQECGSSTLNAKTRTRLRTCSNSTTLHIPSVMCWRATVHVSSAWDKLLLYYTSTECQQLFAPTVSVSSTDLWRTCGLCSRKHGNLQTPGQGQQQNPLNQVNLNTNSPSVLPQHGQQKQSAAFHCRPRTLHFLHLPVFFPSLPPSSLFHPSFLPSFLSSQSSVSCSAPSGSSNLPVEEKSCRQQRQVLNASPVSWNLQARSAVSLCPSVPLYVCEVQGWAARSPAG